MELDNQIVEMEAELVELKQRQALIKYNKGKKSIKCCGQQGAKGCGYNNPISKIDLIQTYWYTEPYSCTGGDYWSTGETNFICLKCGTRNRPCWNPHFKKADIDFIKVGSRFFKSMTEEYNE